MKNEFNTEIIENYLKENKMSKTTFCKLCGVDPCTLMRIMNHENYGVNALFKIARVLKIQVYQMFRNESLNVTYNK